jgi:hypothetical protein
MATAQKARRSASGRPQLPVIDVARFEEIGHLIEQLVAENTDVFVRKGQEYRDAHREGTRRALTVEEATQLAIAAVDDRPVEQRAAAFQNEEGLYAYDQPDRREILVAAGVATAPAFVRACRKAVALIEMPTEEFWSAFDEQRLDDAIDDAANRLRRTPLPEARERTVVALEHLAAAAGDAGGKGLTVLARTIWAALLQAMDQLESTEPAPSSLIASPPATAGPSEPS